jgi:RNA polymerase sigma-70 factor (ECF subfamily)
VLDATHEEDARWMRQVAIGDRAAFALLFDKHHARVLRFCQRMVGDRHRAEELTQEVFIKLFRTAARYQPTARFQTFLFRVATNTCLNEMRRPGHVAGPSSDDLTAEPVSDAETPDQVVEAKDVERALRQALNAMSQRESAAFTMCRFEGMSYRDIAEALDATESAVKSLIHRASMHVLHQLEASTTTVSKHESAA